MLGPRTANIEWPLGSHPDWERDNEDDEDLEDQSSETELKSVADSLVILQSLRHSRDKWLYRTFPKFSSKSRGGRPAEVVPPPHTIHNRGRCEIEIGPHTFSNTVIFEVNYQYIPPTPKPAYAYQTPPLGQTHTWQTTTPYGVVPYATYAQSSTETAPTDVVPTVATTTEAVVAQKSSASPLLSSLGSAVTITPALISQVNTAASSNPTLANLLQLAASGRASPEQLKNLGLLIQSLVGPSNIGNSVDLPVDLPVNSSASGKSQTDTSTKAATPAPISVAPAPASVHTVKTPTLHPTSAPTKEFDIVLEFSENPSDRWVLPRVPVIIERLQGAGRLSDILLTAGVPFPKPPVTDTQEEKEISPADDGTQQLVTFHFRKASSDIWECMSRWAGDQERMETTRKALERLLTKEPERVYLAHQLAAGSLLTQIQNSATPPYSMRSIKPTQGDGMRPKRVRKPAARKPAADNPNSVPPPKRKKAQVKEVPALPKMACIACGQTDVPLIMGGRYCKPCVAPKKPTTEQPQPNGGTFIHKFWAAPQTEEGVLTKMPLSDPQSEPPDAHQHVDVSRTKKATSQPANDAASASNQSQLEGEEIHTDTYTGTKRKSSSSQPAGEAMDVDPSNSSMVSPLVPPAAPKKRRKSK